MQESKPLRSGDEIKFFEALEDKKIIHSSLEELKNVLKWVMIKVGLRSANFPNEEEKGILIDHILKEYGGHTCQEIKTAFEMAMAGKLEDINLKNELVTVNPNCYENFSCLYFSSIMNPYRVWAARVYNLLPRQEFKQLVNKGDVTDEEMQEWFDDWKIKIKTIENPMLIPPSFYRWLEEKGLLILTKDQKLEYLTSHAVHVRQFNLSESAKSEGEHGESKKILTAFTKMREGGVFEGEEVPRLKELAKKIAVFDYLKKLSIEND